MEFKTSSQWLHQVGVHEDGFYWDSSSYEFSKVLLMWGQKEQKNVNLIHQEQLDEFSFTLFMDGGETLEQGIKTLAYNKAVFLPFASLENATEELFQLYLILLGKTFDSRVRKYTDYKNEHGRWLLSPNALFSAKKNSTFISSNERGDIYRNNSFFGNLWDGSLKIWRDGRDTSLIIMKEPKVFGARVSINTSFDQDILHQIVSDKLHLEFK